MLLLPLLMLLLNPLSLYVYEYLIFAVFCYCYFFFIAAVVVVDALVILSSIRMFIFDSLFQCIFQLEIVFAENTQIKYRIELADIMVRSKTNTNAEAQAQAQYIMYTLYLIEC